MSWIIRNIKYSASNVIFGIANALDIPVYKLFEFRE
jgi:hypothetical protein